MINEHEAYRNSQRSNRSVLVLGAGIVGIQTATDLANMGFTVYLVERTPSIGGRMAQLDKTFPTNDCSICILAPKMIDCHQHPNIRALVNSELINVDGTIGEFRAEVRKNATYVNWDRCTGCGLCMEKCPVKLSSEFNMGLSFRKAIYIPFLQAVPKKVTIDAAHCTYFRKGRCRLCEKFCPSNAIEFNQKDEILNLNVAAIVLATGFDFYEVSKILEYGYGQFKNVITAVEYERIICASGPTGGLLHRPSDGRPVKKLAFIQCTGSRNINHMQYCSAVCCMHSTKEAILANEHEPETESYIFYMDLRAVGKRFQEYMERAEREYRVHFIRARPGRITENPENHNPLIWYEETMTGEVKVLEVELAVLAQALVPKKDNTRMAKILGLELDDYGFVLIPDRKRYPVDTTRPGVFAAGFCQYPQDIPDGVVQASCAAARVAEVLRC